MKKISVNFIKQTVKNTKLEVGDENRNINKRVVTKCVKVLI